MSPSQPPSFSKRWSHQEKKHPNNSKFLLKNRNLNQKLIFWTTDIVFKTRNDRQKSSFHPKILILFQISICETVESHLIITNYYTKKNKHFKQRSFVKKIKFWLKQIEFCQQNKKKSNKITESSLLL